jgi:hypothetical protein
MKEVFYFLQWQWRRFEFWQKSWIFAMALIGAGTTAPDTWRLYLLGAGSAIILAFMAKWIFWDGVKSAWNNYQEEKDKVIRILAAEGERESK